MSSRKEQKDEARAAREAKEKELATAAAKRRRLSIFGGVIGLALIAAIAAVVVSSSDTSGTTTASDAAEVNARYAGIPQMGEVLGEPAAKAMIVEFGDLRCSHCKEFEEQVMPTVVDELVKTGKAKFVYRNMTILDQLSPSQKDSTSAARYAVAAGMQNKMFPFTNLFFLNQGIPNQDYATGAFLMKLAGQVNGLNPQEAADNTSNPKVTEQLDRAAKQAAKLGVRGTPAVFVGADEDSLKPIEDTSNPQAIIDAVESLQ